MANDDDDDISLMSLTDDELQGPDIHSQNVQTTPPQAAHMLDHATLWAEVDTDELERIAVNIAQNAVFPTENSEAVSRLNITANCIETDNKDPLGFGSIDTRVLSLSQAVPGAGGRGGKSGMLGRGTCREENGADVYGAAPASEEAVSSLLRNKVLPVSEQFDPELYLQVIHTATSLHQLSQGLHNLKLQLSVHTGQLKALVKENFDRFISSKNTIDDIYAKLQKSEADGSAGVEGTSTSEVLAAVTQVKEDAQRAFGPLLDRQAKAERIKVVLGMMRRYEAVVRLPSRVRQHANASDYEQVVADYRKARALLADHKGAKAQHAQQDSMWLKLMEEVDKVVSGVAVDLETAVRSPSSSAEEVCQAIKFLMQLRVLGVKAAQGIDPIRLYISNQEQYMMGQLEAAQQQHRDWVATVQRRQQEMEEREAQLASFAGLGIHPSPSLPSPSSTDLSQSYQLPGMRHVAMLTSILSRWIPPFWVITQEELPSLAVATTGGVDVEEGVRGAVQAVERVVAAFRQAVQECLGAGGVAHSLKGPPLNASALLGILRELVSSYLTMQQMEQGPDNEQSGAVNAWRCPPPRAALEALCNLAELAAEQGILRLKAELQEAVGKLCQGESWAVDIPSQRAGKPATCSVLSLDEVVSRGMQHLKAVLQEAARVQVNPLRKSAAPARDAFFTCFAAYARQVSQLGKATHAAQQGEPLQQDISKEVLGPLPSPDRRLLLLCSNVAAVRTRVLGRQCRTWLGMLQAGGGPKECQVAAAQCSAELEAVEHQLVVAYVERKQLGLDEVMEEYFFGDGTAWECAPPPHAVRPVVLHLLHSLTNIQWELSCLCPAVLRQVVAELVTSLVEGFCQLVAGNGMLPAGMTAGAVCQLWLEARYLAATVGALGWQALGDALSRLEEQLVLRLRGAVQGAEFGWERTAASFTMAQLLGWCGEDAAGGEIDLVQLCEAKVVQLCRMEVLRTAGNLVPLQLLAVQVKDVLPSNH